MTRLPEFCRLDRRKRAIIDAARALFVEQGYERTTLKDIVDRAGGSLATVYKVFGNKDGPVSYTHLTLPTIYSV